jgi:RNA polymerase sigma-70 factor (ECF subfamily)
MIPTPPSLLERLRQHDADTAEAWERFVELYSPLLYGLAIGRGLHGDDAADLVQDVFVILIQELPEFKYDPQKGKFHSYLQTIVHNRWCDLMRRRARMQSLDPGKDVNIPDPHSLAEIAEDDYRSYLLHQALRIVERDFEPKTWQACWKTLIEGRPAAEVAAELGMKPGAVYQAVWRVRHRLHKELEGLT